LYFDDAPLDIRSQAGAFPVASLSHDTTASDGAPTVDDGFGRNHRKRRGLLRVGAALWVAFLATETLVDCAQARQPANVRQVKNPAKNNAEEPPTGPLAIIISINKQSISLYAGKNLVVRSSVSTGMRGHPTPLGVFTIIEKQKWHRSNLYSAAPMPYMQRITWSGVALHAGALPGYPASHGCIRLSYEFATRLWHLTRTGARVIIAHDDVVPVDIVDPRLFTPTVKIDMVKAAVADSPSSAQAIKTAAAAPADLKAPPQVEVADKLPISRSKPALSAPHRTSPISILISRQLGRLFVRQASATLFDSRVTIRDPQELLGTHVFTASASSTTMAMDWTVVSIPESAEHRAEAGRRSGRTHDERTKVAPAAAAPSAAVALDRIDIPEETLQRISELLVPGSSLIISDHGISDETGSDTDFIVLTR
jgi:hypothetical protein